MIWLNTVPGSVQTAKQNAASAVRNRIPASVDVMIWTVMNMRRSAKNMKLIDADELIKYIKIWEIGMSISSDQKEFINCVNEQFTAFDLDKVVEQLEQLKMRYFLTIANTGDADKDCAYKSWSEEIPHYIRQLCRS